MNRPGTPLSVASEKRTFKPGVIMAAPAIIGTVPRKFPLGGTLSHSNWTSNDRARLSDADLDRGPFLDAGPMPPQTSRADGSKWVTLLLQVPAGAAASAAPGA